MRTGRSQPITTVTYRLGTECGTRIHPPTTIRPLAQRCAPLPVAARWRRMGSYTPRLMADSDAKIGSRRHDPPPLSSPLPNPPQKAYFFALVCTAEQLAAVSLDPPIAVARSGRVAGIVTLKKVHVRGGNRCALATLLSRSSNHVKLAFSVRRRARGG